MAKMKERTVIVTGTARGIVFAIAEAFVNFKGQLWNKPVPLSLLMVFNL